MTSHATLIRQKSEKMTCGLSSFLSVLFWNMQQQIQPIAVRAWVEWVLCHGSYV